MPVRACPSANAFRRNREVRHKPDYLSSGHSQRDFAYQTPKYESDVFSHNRRWLSAKPETSAGSLRNKGSIRQAKRAGITGKQKKPFLKFPIDKKYEEKGINLLEKLSFPKRTTRTGAV
ncbi:hypothetical protein [Rhizobium sp. AN95]|uniref:hypothetical protein n=1 Tax=Rhizobium sp. AN95 TaxID=3035216 RepID=UPI002B2572A2|nr:hypothetical protein [Rhizobium sp. AN95]